MKGKRIIISTTTQKNWTQCDKIQNHLHLSKRWNRSDKPNNVVKNKSNLLDVFTVRSPLILTTFKDEKHFGPKNLETIL